MRKIVFVTILASFIGILILSSSNRSAEAAKRGDIYYFEAVNCSACVRAKEFFAKEGSDPKYSTMNLRMYTIYDGKWRVRKKHMKVLVRKMEALKRKNKSKPFIYEGKKLFSYYTKKGIPYYVREGKYSRKDDKMPTPIFIIGNNAYVGFNKRIISRAIADYLK